MRTRSLVRAEATIHEMVCSYLKLQYPNVIFRTDFSAGVKMSMYQAIKHKKLQSSRAYPDLFIAEPRAGKCGLFLELKREGTRIVLKNGELTTNEHVREQDAMLQQLRLRGYEAEFAIGFDAAVEKIEAYLNAL